MSDWFSKLYRLEMYGNWSLGHANLPLQAFQTFLLLTITIGAFYAALAVAAGLTVIMVVGWYGVEKGLLRKQNSLANIHNKELMQAARRK